MVLNVVFTLWNEWSVGGLERVVHELDGVGSVRERRVYGLDGLGEVYRLDEMMRAWFVSWLR